MGGGRLDQAISINRLAYLGRDRFAVTNQNRRPERRIFIEIVLGLDQTVECLRVDTVEDLGSIDTDEDSLSATLHDDLGVRR
jgi:hypothetical protein